MRVKDRRSLSPKGRKQKQPRTELPRLSSLVEWTVVGMNGIGTGQISLALPSPCVNNWSVTFCLRSHHSGISHRSFLIEWEDLFTSLPASCHVLPASISTQKLLEFMSWSMLSDVIVAWCFLNSGLDSDITSSDSPFLSPYLWWCPLLY